MISSEAHDLGRSAILGCGVSKIYKCGESGWELGFEVGAAAAPELALRNGAQGEADDDTKIGAAASEGPVEGGVGGWRCSDGNTGCGHYGEGEDIVASPAVLVAEE